MFKKILIAVLFLFLTIGTNASLANEGVVEVVESSQSARPVEYALAYPGLLPGDPLYFLKAVRDNIISFLITNPVKKAEFSLLRADKYVEGSRLLFDKKEVDRSVQTFSMALSYYEKALEEAKSERGEKEEMQIIKNNLYQANAKYIEVLGVMKTKFSEKENKKFEEIERKLKDQRKRVEEFGS